MMKKYGENNRVFMIKMQNSRKAQRKTWVQGGPCTKIQCVVRGVPQTRVSQVMAGESFARDRLHQEVSVSPASALRACRGFKVGAAQFADGTCAGDLLNGK